LVDNLPCLHPEGWLCRLRLIDVAATQENTTPREFMMNALEELARKLGLTQTPSSDAAKEWASRCRELAEDGTTFDQAAIVAAKNIFPTEFRPTQYKQVGSIETLLDEIEKFASHERTTGKIIATWRVEFFANEGDNLPARYITIEAADENDAASKAANLMSGSEMRVDIHRTVVKR
jgi:hypothetical protein